MKRAVMAAIILCISGGVYGQREKPERATPEAQRPASDAHSFMELFTKLERDWMLAVQRKDQVALESILAPEFMERTAADPQHPIPRADWIKNAIIDYNLQSFEIQDVSIRSFLDNAVISFEERLHNTKSGRDDSSRYFIVELWIVNHGRWQVARRFSSLMGQ